MMKIVARTITILCLLNLILGQQNEVDDKSEAELIGDSGWWSKRITKFNGKVGQGIGLENEDNERGAGRWDKGKTEIRDSRRRPRPFASVQHSSAETRSRDHHYSAEGEGNFLNDKVTTPTTTTTRIILDFRTPTTPVAPSPILLPPYATPSPVYRNSNDITVKSIVMPSSELNNESSSNKTGKSSVTPELERTRIHEITKLNSTNSKNEEVDVEASYANLTKSFPTENVDEGWSHFQRENRVNRTKSKNFPEFNDKSGDSRASFDVDEQLRKLKIGNFETSKKNIYPVKNRGHRRYQDNIEDERRFTRKRTYLRRYEWGRRSGQRSHHLRLREDPDTEVGSVPGVPGRDYPIHQEHTHHHLRNIADRFSCPQSPKTHVYLADRASRCQIFYVCYGSKTGVPMVCPNGTLFSEPLQVCDWWYNVSC